MDLDIVSVLYLAYKLSPFIIMSYLSLFSIINKEYKGLVLLCGVLLSCFLTTLISKSSMFDKLDDYGHNNDELFVKCNILTLTKDGPISKIPLSINIFSFLLCYFSLCVSKNKLIYENIFTLIIFTSILLADIYFISSNYCSSYIHIISGILFGFLFGAIWYYIIDASNNPDLQFFNGNDSSEVCNKTDTSFSCRVVSV